MRRRAWCGGGGSATLPPAVSTAATKHPKGRAGPSADPASAAERLAAQEREERYKPLDRALVGRLLGLLGPYKWRYALGIGLGTVMVLLEMQSPRFIAAIISTVEGFSVETAAAGGPARSAFTDLGPPTAEQSAAAWRVASIVGLWALALLSAVALQRAAILVMVAAGERVQFDIRRRLFAHLQAMSMSYYDRTKPRAGHQPLHERRRLAARGERVGHQHGVAQRRADRRGGGEPSGVHGLAFVPERRVARAGAVRAELLLPPAGGADVAGGARGVHAGQHEPGGEHHGACGW